MGLGGNVELRSEGIITVLILKSMAGYSPKLGASLLGAFLAWTLLPGPHLIQIPPAPAVPPPGTSVTQMLFL